MTADQMESYQVVMEGHGTFSAPYIDRKEAESRADELGREITDKSFSVEEWPNHRQEEGDDGE